MRKPALRLCWIGLLSVAATGASAQDWLLIEAHRVRSTCGQPIECLEDGDTILRNLLSLTPSNEQDFLRILNSAAMIRNIPDSAVAPPAPPLSGLSDVLHPIPVAEKLAPLVDHPGVFFDDTRLAANPLTAAFGGFVREQLSAAGLKFLTEEQMEATPGRPVLSVSFTERRESAGCIIPFRVSVAITEEVALVRNPNLKLKSRIWSFSTNENLANRNFTPTSALQESVAQFVRDWNEANGQ